MNSGLNPRSEHTSSKCAQIARRSAGVGSFPLAEEAQVSTACGCPKEAGCTSSMGGWSEADREGEPLYDPAMSRLFIKTLKEALDPLIPIVEVDHHINDHGFAQTASSMMDEMLR